MKNFILKDNKFIPSILKYLPLRLRSFHFISKDHSRALRKLGLTNRSYVTI